MNDLKKLTIETLSKALSNVPLAIHKAFWREQHFAKGKKMTKDEYSSSLSQFLGEDK